MSEVDEATALAWSRFHRTLEQGLAEGSERLWMKFDVPVGATELSGERPWLRVMRGTGSDRVTLWVPGNKALDPAYALADDARRFLLDSGWESHHQDRVLTLKVGREDAAHAAAQAMHALRQVFGVVHPSFLELNHGAQRLMGSWDEPEHDDPDDADAEIEDECSCPAEAHDLEPWAEDEEPLALVCESPDELLHAARRSLVATVGHLPCLDEDGDIPVAGDRAMLWVRACTDEPRLELFSTIVDGVKRRGAASIEVGLLNRDHPYLKFRHVGSRIIVRAALPAVPFCPAQLRLVVEHMQEALRDDARDLATRCGGEPWAVFDLG